MQPDLVHVDDHPTPAPAPSQRIAPAPTRAQKRERYGPWVVGAMATLVSLALLPWDKRAVDLITAVVPTATSVAAILAGFLGTAHAMLLSLRGSATLRTFDAMDQVETLVMFLRWSLTSLVLVVVVGLVALLLSVIIADHTRILWLVNAAMAGLLTVGLATNWRVAVTMLHLLAAESRNPSR